MTLEQLHDLARSIGRDMRLMDALEIIKQQEREQAARESAEMFYEGQYKEAKNG